MRMYLVSYSKYSYEDEITIHIFVTPYENHALAYVNKFNNILDKWYNYYKRYSTNNGHRLAHEHKGKYGRRWWQLQNINEAEYTEVEYRTLKR